MRVLFVYKYLTLGGVESVLRARLEGLPEQGVDAQAWFLSEGEGRSVFRGVERRIHVGGLDAFRSYLAAVPQDVVSSIDTEEVLPLIDPAGRTKLVVEAHSPYLENLEYLRHMDRSGVAAFFVPSAHQRAVAQERIGSGVDVRVIPNALRQCFVERNGGFRPLPPRPIVAWIGRLDPLKNWEGFLAIARQIAREVPEVEFWMVAGSSGSPMAEELFHRASRLGIAGSLVWYLGFPHERLPSLLDAVRESGGAVISTSRGESFGMAIAEAMARGCAVVAPETGPFPEFIVQGESGMLYPPRSMDAAAKAVLALLRSHALRWRYGEQARADVLSAYAPGRALGKLAEELRAACRAGQAADRPADRLPSVAEPRV
jgi:glycosyltransferase involved in cell wall biosynthesis